MVIASFLFFLAVFVAVGAASVMLRKEDPEDYLVAGRSVSPWLTALSSVATNNSGFMFVGLIGFTYRGGLHTVWMALGWILGDLLVWLWVHRRVRELSGKIDAASVPGLLGWRKDGVDRVVVVLAGLATFLFLGGYAAAQLNAGSAALHSLFGWEPWVGAVLGAVIVVIYCYAGGLRASIWTDAAQSVVMLGSMLVLLGISVATVGGPGTLYAELMAIDPALVRWFPEDTSWAFVLYFLSFIAGGFGAVGQPHILVRSMAIESPAAIARARLTYFGWFVPFYVAAIGVALYARVLVPELMVPPTGLEGPAAEAAVIHATERALPELAIAMLPEFLIGMMLAGLFSATMSTADSQLLSCSAAVTQDIAPRWKDSYAAGKLATLAIAALALAIALTAGEGVFALVLASWSALGAALGPLVLVQLFGRNPPTPVAVAMMASGLITVFAWPYTPWADTIFKLLPGLIVPMVIYGLGRAAGPVPQEAQEGEEAVRVRGG